MHALRMARTVWECLLQSKTLEDYQHFSNQWQTFPESIRRVAADLSVHIPGAPPLIPDTPELKNARDRERGRLYVDEDTIDLFIDHLERQIPVTFGEKDKLFLHSVGVCDE